MTSETDLSAYTAAREAAAVADAPGWGWLRLSGRDRLDLLHRLSTNAVKTLAAGQGAVTVLTSPVGRVMAVVTVYAGENEAYLRVMPAQAGGVTRYLNSMIFWQDQVEIANLTDQIRPDRAVRAASAGRVRAGRSGAGRHGGPRRRPRVRLAVCHHCRARPSPCYRGGPLEPAAWIVVAPAAECAAVRTAFDNLPALDASTVEVLRDRSRVAFWGRELNDEVTPLETGLLPAVSFNKGCYTGQEVIARQTNYDKVTRNLVGLEFAAEDAVSLAQSGSAEAGEAWGRVRGPGRGGFVGSVAYSPAPRGLRRPGCRAAGTGAGGHGSRSRAERANVEGHGSEPSVRYRPPEYRGPAARQPLKGSPDSWLTHVYPNLPASSRSTRCRPGRATGFISRRPRLRRR